jgi:ATP-dependent DNA helicase PIF1
LLSIGEGRHEVNEDGEVRLPDDMCIHDVPSTANEEADLPDFRLLRLDDNEDDTEGVSGGQTEDDATKEERNINALVDAVYPRVGSDDLPDENFAERGILAPTNRQVHRINEVVAQRLPGETREYLSTDTAEGIDESLFETEFLNSLEFSGIPPHRIVLKVGASIMMIRNINSHEGLCNGTCLHVMTLRDNCIDAVIMVGPRKGQRVFIPRIIFISDDDDKDFPFQLRRKQFPVVPAFAITINKAQGQSIHHMGLYLRTPVFSHGQLYVALSRVTSRSAIKILVPNQDNDDADGVHTKNIVYRQIFFE